MFLGVQESLVNRRNLGKLERIDKKASLTSLLNQMLTHLLTLLLLTTLLLTPYYSPLTTYHLQLTTYNTSSHAFIRCNES